MAITLKYPTVCAACGGVLRAGEEADAFKLPGTEEFRHLHLECPDTTEPEKRQNLPPSETDETWGVRVCRDCGKTVAFRRTARPPVTDGSSQGPGARLAVPGGLPPARCTECGGEWESARTEDPDLLRRDALATVLARTRERRPSPAAWPSVPLAELAAWLQVARVKHELKAYGAEGPPWWAEPEHRPSDSLLKEAR